MPQAEGYKTETVMVIFDMRNFRCGAEPATSRTCCHAPGSTRCRASAYADVNRAAEIAAGARMRVAAQWWDQTDTAVASSVPGPDRSHLSCAPSPHLCFPPHPTRSLKNADLPFIRFFIKIMFDYYPKRISQVLLVAAPLAFQPMWGVVKPLLGKYASLVRFVTVQEAEAFFPQQPGSGSPLI